MTKKARLIMKHRVVGSVVAAMVAAIVAAGVVIASGSSTQRAKGETRGHSDFAVFSASAQVESAEGGEVPEGAVLAGTSSATGQVSRVYAWERVPGEYCLLELEAADGRTVACSSQAEAEQDGIVIAGGSDEYAGTNVVAVVPNGVSLVTFTDSDGSTHKVAVSNNFADYYANSGGVTKASFDLPDGEQKETRFAAPH